MESCFYSVLGRSLEENRQDRLIKGLIGYGVQLGHWDTDSGIFVCGGGS
jgi:hypothetical protein